MNACPDDSDLLHFLDGELNAGADARIVAHIEDCSTCQARLERLTGGSPAPGEGEPIETVATESEETTDLAGTEILALDLGEDRHNADSDSSPSTVFGRETCDRFDEATDPMRTSDFRLSPSSDHDRITDDAGLDQDATWDVEPGPKNRTRPSSHGTTIPNSEILRRLGLGEDATDDEPGPIIRTRPSPHWPTIPNYEILQRLGIGGMGVVYKARHLGLKRLVAVKMIRSGSEARADHLSRFLVEAEAVARLRHPNIIQIYDIGEADGLPFVALELLDGGGLDGRLAGNPQPPREAAELMVTLARAVHVAHQAGIVHRDLKPTNVLYSSDGVPKITDFGLAKRIDSDAEHTQSGQIMGSPSYMAPEQARGDSRKVGPAADVYALGAILYEMLTGRPPFKGETPLETVRQVVDDDPVAPSHLVPRVSRDLETICLKCLQKEPARRYESAEALADDLTRYLRGEPILARRTNPVVRGLKWGRRHPLAAAILATIIAAIPISFGAVLKSQRDAIESERRENARLTGLRTMSTRQLLQAKGELEKDKLSDAKVTLTALGENIRKEPGLSDLMMDVETAMKQVEQRQSEQDSRESNHKRYAEFLRLRDESLIHDTRYTGLDLPGNQQATRGEALAALALFADPGSGDSWKLASIPTSLSKERATIVEVCYELLLILAESETTPEQGLRRLDQAARFRPMTRAYHLRRAACLAQLADKPAAERERRAADGLKPSTAFDHFLAGQERFAQKDYSAASREFDMALQLEPDRFWAQALSAVCSLRLGQPVEAKASLNACLQREKGFAWLYILRGFASGQVAGIARELLEKRAGPVERVDQLYEAADSDYRTAMEILDRNPNDDLRYSVLVNRGVLRLLLRRDLDEAVGHLQAAIRLRPREFEAYAALAKVFQRQDKPDEAIEQFRLAIKLSPLTAALYRDRAGVDLGRVKLTSSQRARALGDLEEAIRLESPDNRVLSRDHFGRARLLALDHRHADALNACDAAIKIDSDYDDAHRLRIESLSRLNRDDDVIRSCDSLIARGKATSAIYELRGLARTEIKDFPGAIEDCTNAMLLSGNREALLRRRGWLYIVADAPQLARHDFEAAIRLDATTGDAYNGRGFARVRQGEHRQAVADAEKALAVGEPKPDLYYKAARVYAVAAIAAAAEVRKKGRETVTLVSQYQDRAADLLRETLKRLPVERRPTFLKDVIRKDPQLQPLIRRIAAPDLAGPIPSAVRSPNRQTQ